MGLSSSQARLLNLTARMHQIEYKAAKLEAQKLQMANESRRVYEEYLDSLDDTKIQFMTLKNDGSPNYVDATYNKLLAMGYVLKMPGDDAEVVTQDVIDNYLSATDGGTSFGDANRLAFAMLQTGRVDSNFANVNDGVTEVYTAHQLADLIANNPTGLNCRLMLDINMSGVSYSSQNVSNMQFDGNGHTITALSTALFDTVSGNSNISNLSLNGDVISRGMLANTISTSGVISNVSVSGSVNNYSSAGGLANEITMGTIEYCTSTANVISSGGIAGGLARCVVCDSTTNPVIIRNCSVTGDVSSNSSGGGFIGYCKNVNISNCTSSGNITTNLAGGGFIGYIPNASQNTITNCSTTSNIYVTSPRADLTSETGGFIGWTTTSYGTTVEIRNCSSSGEIHYNSAASTPAGQAKLEALRAAGNAKTTYIGAFAGTMGNTQIYNCDTTSTIINDWSSDAGTTVKGAFAGQASNKASGSGNYSSDTSIDFVGTDYSTATFESASVSAPNVTTPVVPASAPAFTQQVADVSGTDDASALFDRMHTNGYKLIEEDDPRLTHGDDPVWLRNMVNEGMIYIFKPDSDNVNFHETSVATDTNLREVDDETLLRKAEAKYEADMRKIDRKDRMYDHELAKLDNERNAIKQEMETLKTVAKENVERTFKLFS